MKITLNNTLSCGGRVRKDLLGVYLAGMTSCAAIEVSHPHCVRCGNNYFTDLSDGPVIYDADDLIDIHDIGLRSVMQCDLCQIIHHELYWNYNASSWEETANDFVVGGFGYQSACLALIQPQED